MRELRAEITINAPAERIWDTLTGLESVQDWNPFMRRASGDVQVGNRLRIHDLLDPGINPNPSCIFPKSMAS